MPHTFLERWRIHQKAKRLLGIEKKDSERLIFMQQCMEDMQGTGEADDVDDARDICELLWDEQQQYDGDDEDF